MIKIVFLVSGSGGNLKFFHQAMAHGLIDEMKISVIADRDCGAIQHAKKANLENITIKYNRESPDELQAQLERINPDIIITNWNKIIDPKTIQKNQGKFINLHYSLLPAFSGLMGVEPIKQAYEKGCKFIGPTCHMVDEGVDTGPIISQAAFTTNRSIQDAIELMFRLGCLILLNGVYITQKNSEFIENRKENPQFSPPLRFDISCFDENLWQKVANA